MSKKRGGLGRGFDAFISDKAKIDRTLSAEKLPIEEVPIEDIKPNEDQPRKHFDLIALEELSTSIKEHGVLQPILLNNRDGQYQIVAGERRYRASKMAGLETIPAIIRTFSPEEQDKIALIENVQREDLTPVEEARGYKSILESYNMTQAELAQAIGKSRPYVANITRLLKLDPRVLDLVQSGDISQSMGRELLSIEDNEEQYEKALEIIEKGLSIAQLTQAKAKKPKAKPKKMPQTSTTPSHKDLLLGQVEQDFEDRLGTRVNIDDTNKTINIDYYDDEDLQRIIEIVIGE